jgi:4'-phosphopantetheinyl transferase
MPDAEATVLVRWLPLDVDDTRLAELCGLLSADEAERASRFAFPELRSRFVAGRGQLREALAAATGRDARGLVFIEGQNGKPALESGDVEFNLSHSGGAGVVAISPAGCAVGVDIECIARKTNIAGIAERFFPREDFEEIHALPEDDARRAFFRHWTTREAVMKATGLGMQLSPQRIHVRFDGGEGSARVEPRELDAFPSHWHLTLLRDDGEIAATLATPHPVLVEQRGAL